jgi:hypothetical protein
VWEGDVSVPAFGLRALALGAALFAAATPASAAGFFEKNFYMIGPRYDAKLPPCDDPSALHTIQKRFSTKESRFWNSELTIVNFEKIRETAYMPWAEGSIPRRFCSGRALISDGIWRTVHYSIVEDGGMIGWTWGVQWCVVGIDRNWAYNPQCKMARP